MDGNVDRGHIADHLASKYDELYNYVPSDEENMDRTKDYISEYCEKCEEHDRVVNQHDVDKALDHLNANKSDYDVGSMSNHLIMCREKFQTHLGLLITAILTHGYQPKTVLTAIIASLPKDNRGNICDSKNYRGITICSSISKIIDIILIMRYKDKLQISDMQFAFKDKHSTVMCCLVVKEVVRYYVNNKFDVYSCCVDASKAFDKAKHDKLFELLIERKIPALAFRTLVDMYQR